MTMPETFADIAEFYGIDASSRLDRESRARLRAIHDADLWLARFMAGLFTNLSGDVVVIDPGAGAASLTLALAERMCTEHERPQSARLVCYEIEPLLSGYLRRSLEQAKIECKAAGIAVATEAREQDFILTSPAWRQDGLFDSAVAQFGNFYSRDNQPALQKD